MSDYLTQMNQLSACIGSSWLERTIRRLTFDRIISVILASFDCDLTDMAGSGHAQFTLIDGWQIDLWFKRASDYGLNHAAGKHLFKPSEFELGNALELAQRDLYPAIYLYF